MPLSSEGPSRSFRQNVALAVLLAWVAGAVNAAGFLVLGTHTSHVTGNATALGEAVATGHTRIASEAGKLLMFFVAGAAAAAALLDVASKSHRGRYTPALAVEAAVLGGVAIWATCQQALLAFGPTQALCFAMGLQNAMVTRISGAVVRTTHMTGVLTDLGMELVHVAGWFVRHVRRDGVAGVAPAFRGLLVEPEFERAGLHLALVSSFLVGATVGALLATRWGEIGLGAPGVVLLGLIALDWRRPSKDATRPARPA